MENTLIATKMNAPLLKTKTVVRKAIADEINKGVNNGYRLTLISAPAGSGKTTLALQWIKTTDINVSWITLDDGDNDPVIFFRYLIASLQKIEKNIGIHALNLFCGPFLPAVRSLVTSLVNDLYESGNAIAIVLDDYHVIRTTYINEFFQYFIENKPEFVHVVILTREDPQLQLSKLRVRNEMTELRAADLCFGDQDACAFFMDVMGIEARRPAIEKILKKTEGWIAGLQLAALSVRGYNADKIEEFANAFGGNNRYIIDYLVEEVLEQLNVPLREFIFATAMLDKMTAGLCDYVLQNSCGAEMLNELYRQNLFLISMDDNRMWFRYHQLFADSISAGLKKEQKKRLWIKAAEWFEQNGYLEEAVGYAIKSGDTDKSLLLIEKLIPDFFQEARLPAFLSLLTALPDAAVNNCPAIAVRKAWALLISGNIQGVRLFTSQLGEDYASSLDTLNKGLYIGLVANLINYEENPDTEKLARQSLQLIGSDDPTARVAVLNTLADAQKRNGKTEEAVESHASAFNTARPLGYSFITLLALYQYAITLDIMGKRKEAVMLAEGFLGDMLQSYRRPVPLMGILYALLAPLYYEENNLAKAEEYAFKAQVFLLELSLNWIINVDTIIMNIHLARGKTEEAREMIDNLSAKPTNFRVFEFRNSAAKAELDLRQERVTEVLEWASAWGLMPEDKPNATREPYYFTFIRVLLLNNSLDKAAKLIESLESSIAQGVRHGRLIPLLILKSVYHALKSEDVNASDCLSRAVSLAAPQKYIRAFLDEGPLVYEMLQKLPGRDTGFIRTLIEQFGVEPEGNKGWTRYLKPGQPAESGGCGLVEALSDRELEILHLIAQGMTNVEISGKLYISINTTQWHITNIYGKLGVKNRTQAIAKARELKLTRYY